MGRLIALSSWFSIKTFITYVFSKHDVSERKECKNRSKKNTASSSSSKGNKKEREKKRRKNLKRDEIGRGYTTDLIRG